LGVDEELAERCGATQLDRRGGTVVGVADGAGAVAVAAAELHAAASPIIARHMSSIVNLFTPLTSVYIHI
jgi:hypothetical protein